MNGSLTHGALAQMSHEAGKKHDFEVYVDLAYMPGLTKDAEIMRDKKVPWFHGRTSKRHPLDFDVILFSFALTMEIWNIIPGMVFSGISPFKTQRNMDLPLNHDDSEPVIIFGGVVSDFIEVMYGKVGDEECVPDVTIIGDGEYTIHKALNLLHECKKEGTNKTEYLKRGHKLPENNDFERDAKGSQRYSWWYEPDLYEHIYEESKKPFEWTEVNVTRNDKREIVKEEEIPHVIKYKELRDIIRKPGNDHAAEPGQIKRAIVRDLNEASVWEEAPIQFDGSLGPAVDIQISSGCLSGGLCSFCHTPETPVVLANGQTKRIDEIEPGTAIITADGQIRPVSRIYKREVDEEIAVWKTSSMVGPVKTTLNHKFPAISKAECREKAFTNADLKWEDLQEVQMGELSDEWLMAGPQSTLDAPVLDDISIYQREHYQGTVYNLEVASEEHSYRVGVTPPPQEAKEILAMVAANPELRQDAIELL